jgi:hypothetical protein
VGACGTVRPGGAARGIVGAAGGLGSGGGVAAGGAAAGSDGAVGNGGAAKGGGIGAAGAAAGGGEAGADAEEGTAPPLEGPRTTRVNSPGAADAPKGVTSGLLVDACRGSRLSVNAPGAGTERGTGAEAAGRGVLADGGILPKIRVNSPGGRVEGEDVGSEFIGDSAGWARGL